MPSWQPIMTPLKVVIIVLVVGICFIPTGVSLMRTSQSIFEQVAQYDGQGNTNVDCAITSQNENKPCTITFTFKESVEGPLYVYYQLDNFYQNHRKYVSSVSYEQLAGIQLSASYISAYCTPLTQVKDVNGSLVTYNPCGLIANSFFNDIISVSPSSNYTLDESNIAWPTDKDKFAQVDGFQSYNFGTAKPSLATPVTCRAKGLNADCLLYKNPTTLEYYYYYYPDNSEYQYLYESYDNIDPIKGVTDEHFMVWMRSASLPKFRKLYGKIDSNFEAGDTIQFDINANFEVDSFDGSKYLVISTAGEFGGKNPSLGIGFVVVGSISLFLGTLFGLKSLLSPRAIGNAKLLKWT